MRFEDLIMGYFCIYMKSMTVFCFCFFSSHVALPFFPSALIKTQISLVGECSKQRHREGGTQQERDRQGGGQRCLLRRSGCKTCQPVFGPRLTQMPQGCTCSQKFAKEFPPHSAGASQQEGLEFKSSCSFRGKFGKFSHFL